MVRQEHCTLYRCSSACQTHFSNACTITSTTVQNYKRSLKFMRANYRLGQCVSSRGLLDLELRSLRVTIPAFHSWKDSIPALIAIIIWRSFLAFWTLVHVQRYWKASLRQSEEVCPSLAVLVPCFSGLQPQWMQSDTRPDRTDMTERCI